jgi:hypothetical protein
MHMTRIARITVGVVLVTATAALAQTRTFIRVVKDRSIIWRLSMPTPMTTVDSGTLLEVVRREGDWYVVLLPEGGGFSATDTGRIAASQVELVDVNTLRAQDVPPRRSPVPPDRRGTQAQQRGTGLSGFAQVGYNAWRARDTFTAVLGHRGGPVFGAGGEFRVGNSFAVDAAFDYFEKTGQRVFVHGEEVFKLGIRDTVRVIPLYATATYRQRSGELIGYVGGGIGRYLYKETSDFAAAGENINQQFTSYHGVIGMEFGGWSALMRLAAEVQITSVSKALGTSGASAAFGDTNLGGVQVRLKVLAGR